MKNELLRWIRLHVAAAGLLAAATSQAQTNADWLGGDGNWSDPTQWSIDPNYPNNGQPTPGDTDIKANHGQPHSECDPRAIELRPHHPRRALPLVSRHRRERLPATMRLQPVRQGFNNLTE